MNLAAGRSSFKRTCSEALLLTHGSKDHNPKWNYAAVEMNGPVGSPTPKTESNSTTDLGQSLTDYTDLTRISNRRNVSCNLSMEDQIQHSSNSSSRVETGIPIQRQRKNTAVCPFFRFSPSGKGLHIWFGIISLAVTYNLWVIVYRYAFSEIDKTTFWFWFLLDYSADLLYLFDMIVSLRTGYYEDGVLQFDSKRMRIHYLNSTQFYIDCLSLLPLDFLYLSLGYNSMFRVFRLCKLYKFWHFVDRTERHASHPHLVRSIKLLFYYITILHWNSCIFKIASDFVMRRQLHSQLNESRDMNQTELFNHTSFVNQTELDYLKAVYEGMVNLISIDRVISPHDSFSYVFKIVQAVVGIVLFATILGHVSSIISHTSAAQKEFQARLDGVKNYLSIRCVPYPLQERVINWFDYLWYTNKITDEENVLNSLPDKLKAEIAIQMHLDTLKRVEIFQNTEEGFLSELVLRLRMVLFAPGDYVCRKGEIGKQMFIVNRGTLHVLGDDGKTILATLRAGSYFGELSILNLGQYGNRRTASVRSLGYSDLFRLSKSDLWEVLKDYPGARRKLELHAYKKIGEYKLMSSHGPGKMTDKAIDAPFINVVDDVGQYSVTDRMKSSTRSCRMERMSREGSDGYGSEPSRLSAQLCTPQQSPTPPVTCLVHEHELLVPSPNSSNLSWGNANPTAVQYTYGGVHLHESDALIGHAPQPIISEVAPHADSCNGNTSMAAALVTDRMTHRTSAFDFFRTARNNDVSLPKSRNFSVPSDLVDSVTQKYWLNYLEYDITNRNNVVPNDVCQLQCVSEVRQNQEFLDGPSSALVQFDLAEDSTSLKPEARDLAKINRVIVESNQKNVPVICFEEASTSSSSCSPQVTMKSNIDPLFLPNTTETMAASYIMNDSPECLNVPRGRVSSSSSSSSSRPPYPRLTKSTTQPWQLMSMHKTPGQPQYDRRQSYSDANGNKYESLLNELLRLQQRVSTLEHENTILLRKQRTRSSLDSVNLSTTGMACYPVQESYDGLPHCFVKRSSSLQVPPMNRGKKGHYRPLRQKFPKTEQVIGNRSLNTESIQPTTSGPVIYEQLPRTS